MKLSINYLYYFLLFLVLVLLFVDRGRIEVPTLATAVGFILMLLISADMSWRAFKRQGRAALVTSLPPSEGGHSTIHPDDVRVANSPIRGVSSKLPNFSVFATGGFVHGGVEWQGQENFFVCPPEHVEWTDAGLICRTRFRRVSFSELQDFIQSELLQLRFFDPRIADIRKNLWFGITSTVDGTSITNLLQAESNFLDQTELINKLKRNLRDKERGDKNQEKDKGQTIYLNAGER